MARTVQPHRTSSRGLFSGTVSLLLASPPRIAGRCMLHAATWKALFAGRGTGALTDFALLGKHGLLTNEREAGPSAGTTSLCVQSSLSLLAHPLTLTLNHGSTTAPTPYPSLLPSSTQCAPLHDWATDYAVRYDPTAPSHLGAPRSPLRPPGSLRFRPTTPMLHQQTLLACRGHREISW